MKRKYYIQTHLADSFLVRGKPSYIGGFITMLDKRLYRSWDKLPQSKKYKDIIEGRLDITKVWRIDRVEDTEDTFGKNTDFSPTSIIKLIEDGQNDAKISLNKMEVLFNTEDLIYDGVLSEQEGGELMKRQRKWAHGQDRAMEMKKE